MSAMSRTQMTNWLPGRNELGCAGDWWLVAASCRPPTPVTNHSEGQIVVLVLEGAGEVLEIVAARRRLGLLSGRGSARALRNALPIPVAARAAAPWGAEHDELTNVDLRGVARLPVFVLPLAVLDAPFDVNLVALLDVAFDDVG